MAEAAPLASRLVFLTGSRAGSAVDLAEGETTFGRDPSCTVTFSSGEIITSARHAAIVTHGGRVTLRDLDSRNGSFVNAERVKERELETGDVVQFGAGGPAARFQLLREAGVEETIDPGDLARAMALIEQTSNAAAGADDASGPSAVTTTREIAVSTARRVARRGWIIAGLAVALGVVVVGFVWQVRSRARLERVLGELAVALTTEQDSRAALERDLAAVGQRYDSLRVAMQAGQAAVATDPRVDAETIREFAKGVALISFAYGYGEVGGDRLLRFAVDSAGEPLFSTAPDGRRYPSIRLGGAGSPLRRWGTATGFLVDSAGLLLTNRHVAEPWRDDQELARLRGRGLDVTGTFLDLRAHFPPGDQAALLVVDTVSEEADVALVRVLGAPPRAPVLPLASREQRSRPGDPLYFIGYPTGVHNLLFRVNAERRAQILQRAGDDVGRLVEELASRRLIQPLITNGSVSDTTANEVIHTAVTTVGGSGGPLIGSNQLVVALHYAVVASPNPADPFRTQRAVPIRYAWELLRR